MTTAVFLFVLLISTQSCQANKSLDEEVSTMLQMLNTTTEPCKDFYQFACGGWIQSVTKPIKYNYGIISQLGDDWNKYFEEVLLDPSEFADFEPVQKASTFVQSCKNREIIEQLDKDAAVPLLEELGGWPVLGNNAGGRWNESNFDLVKIISTAVLYTINPFIAVRVASHPNNSNLRIPNVGTGMLGVGRQVLAGSSEEDTLKRQQYLNYTIKLATMFGASEDTAEEDMTQVLKLKTELAKLILSQSSAATYVKVSDIDTNLGMPAEDDINDLKFTVGDVIKKVMNDANNPIAESDLVRVYNIHYLRNLSTVLNRFQKRDLANFCLLNTIAATVTSLSQRFKDAYANYTGYSLSHTSTEKCVEKANYDFHLPAAYIFVKKRFNEDVKQAALSLVADVRHAFNAAVDRAQWMDEGTKKAAKEKAAAMVQLVGYDEDVLNETLINNYYSNLVVTANKYYENKLEHSKMIKVKILQTVGTEKTFVNGIDKSEWLYLMYYPQVSLPIYLSSQNRLYFGGVLFQSPIFNMEQPRSMNFGGVGSLFASLMTESISGYGKMYDKDGNRNPWWSEETTKNFETELKCVNDQYKDFLQTHFNITDNVSGYLDGLLTSELGIIDSYMAYTNWAKKQQFEEPVPEKLQYTNKQLFFIRFAQVFCLKLATPPTAATLNQRDPPYHFRVTHILRNMPEFSEAFGCKTTDYMNPATKCQVW